MAAQLAVVHLWKEWGLHVLVLLSFTLQVALLVLAEFRRRIDNGVLRAFVWSAYMLADSVAIYAIGHLSVTGQAVEHQVMALWAPLLLVHLGGQDNITAYAVEDNRLWLRHLQTLAVQATGAAYVMYVSLVQEPAVAIGGAGGGHDWLRWAATLLFAVGIVKYGERVLALIRANGNPSGMTYKIAQGSQTHYTCYTWEGRQIEISERDTEVAMAHGLLDVAKDLLKAPLPLVVAPMEYKVAMPGDTMCKVAEMQLSLMHDVLFSKAEVIHTRYGLCTRAFSWVATAVAFFLFHLHQQQHPAAYYHGGNRKDAAVTYVLLAGAVILETVSGLRSLVSTWTWWSLIYSITGRVRCCWRVATALAALRRCICAGDCLPRAWSGSMGQLNLFRMCSAAAAASPMISKITQQLGVEDWWNAFAYADSAIPVSPCIKDLLVRHGQQGVGIPKECPEHIRKSRGRVAVQRRWTGFLPGTSGGMLLLESVIDLEFEDSILAWHVATDCYLGWYRSRSRQNRRQEGDDLAGAVEALSNYMFFLLAARPYMLPPGSRDNYASMCSKLIDFQGSEYGCSAEELVGALALHPKSARNLNLDPDQIKRIRRRFSNDLVGKGSELYRCLISAAAASNDMMMLVLIAEVWSEMLCYAGANCSARSHATRLSDGSELITLAALLVRYCERSNIIIPSRDPTTSDGAV